MLSHLFMLLFSIITKSVVLLGDVEEAVGLEGEGTTWVGENAVDGASAVLGIFGFVRYVTWLKIHLRNGDYAWIGEVGGEVLTYVYYF